MKQYIDFVQKPKKGQTIKEETATFISVPGKKPIIRPAAKPATKPMVGTVRRATTTTTVVSRPVAKPTATPVVAKTTVTRTVATAPISHPHYKPDFGPVRRRPLGQPVAIHSATAVVKPTVKPAVKPTVRPAVKPATAPAATPVAKPSVAPVAARPAVKPAARPMAKPIIKPAPKPVEKPVEKLVEKPAKAHKIDDFEEEPLDSFDDLDSFFGVIEDYHPVKQPEAIKKRPLSTPEQRKNRQLTEEIEEFDLEDEEIIAEPEPEEAKAQPSKVDELLKAGKSPFIRTGVIEKRPLSNSVAKIKPVTTPKSPKDEPSDPATIIEKPEKDAHIGIVVTVILTIVFGAAIGTAAFLLLPKN